MKALPLEPGPLGKCVGIKLRGQGSHKFWLQDVATNTIWQKPTLVDVHLLGGSLEVQRH